MTNTVHLSIQANILVNKATETMQRIYLKNAFSFITSRKKKKKKLKLTVRVVLPANIHYNKLFCTERRAHSSDGGRTDISPQAWLSYEEINMITSLY